MVIEFTEFGDWMECKEIKKRISKIIASFLSWLTVLERVAIWEEQITGKIMGYLYRTRRWDG